MSNYENYEDLFRENNDEETTVVQTISSVTKRTATCMIVSTMCHDMDSFRDFLEVLDRLEHHNLMTIIHQMRSDPGAFWKEVNCYKGLTMEVVNNIIEGKLETEVLQSLRALQRSAWITGSFLIPLGLDPRAFVGMLPSSKLRESVLDPKKLILGLVTERRAGLLNPAKRLIRCIPTRLAADLKTDESIINKAIEIVKDFTAGRATITLDVNKFKLPKEPFATIPTTLSPQEAVAVSVCQLVLELYGSSVIVAFGEGDMSQIRRYTGRSDEYLLHDLDKESAYHLSIHPSLHCQDVETNSMWKWRSDDRLAVSRVVSTLAEEGLDGQMQQKRADYLKSFQREIAESYVVESVEDSDKPVFALPRPLQERFNKRMIMRFAKRGYSKAQDVKDDTSCIHIVKAAIADEFRSDYYPVTLADCQSVVLFPKDLWNVNAFVKKNPGPKKMFISRNGVSKLTSSDPVFTFYVFMFQFSHTVHMLGQWASDQVYDPEEYTDFLIENTIVSPSLSLSKHYTGVFSNDHKRKTLFDNFKSIILGNINGAYLIPGTSQIGKRGSEAISNSVSFYDGVSTFDNDITLDSSLVDFDDYLSHDFDVDPHEYSEDHHFQAENLDDGHDIGLSTIHLDDPFGDDEVPPEITSPIIRMEPSPLVDS